VTRAGFGEYFISPAGADAVETVAALEKIGAREVAELLRQAMDVFPGGLPPVCPTARHAAIHQVLDAALRDWNRLDHEFLDCANDLAEQLQHFAKNVEGD
jgi:hypothetical protein